MKHISSVFAFCFILLLSANSLWSATSQTIVIRPGGTMTWDQIVELAAQQPGSASTQPQAAPLMLWPTPKETNFKPSGLKVPQQISGQKQMTPAIPDATQASPLITSFLAVSDDGWIPPDPMGSVGPNHVMTTVNGWVKFQTRTGGALGGSASMANFWSSVGPFTAGAGFGAIFDPRTIYDPGSGRWLATGVCDPALATASILFAISATDDPTGSWTFYRIDADPGNTHWADFPDIGTNSTWIALTANMFPNVSGSVGPAMWVIDKSTALAGGPLTVTWFPMGFDAVAGFSGFSLRPCLTFGPEPKLYLVDNSGWSSGGTSMMRVSEITGTGPAPVWSPTPGSVFLGSGMFLVANNFSYGQIGASQADTNILIESLYPVPINTVFRNGRIWCAHSGGLPAAGPMDRTAVFWYQLDPTALPSPIVQSGVVDGGPGVHHWLPSITANKSDDVMLGFTRSDTTRYPEAVYTSRRGFDPAGFMEPISVLKLGQDSYVKFLGGRNRWGDYTATVVDPVNDSCLWTIQEYAYVGNKWGTWWGSICPGCVAKPGDANASNSYTLSDPIAIVNYVFNKSGCSPQPDCWLTNMLCRGDWDASASATLSDVIRAVNYIFNKPGGPRNALIIGQCCVPYNAP